MLHSLGHQLPQFQIIPGQQESRKLHPADLSSFQIVHPGKPIGKQLPMRASDNSMQIFLADVPFFLPIDESEQS